MADAPPIPVDEHGRVDADLPCMSCGYNLRTLSLRDGRCPECSLPVGRSAVGNKLRYCDPAWVRQIGWGFNLAAACAIAGGLFYGAMRAMGIDPRWDGYEIMPAACFALMMVTGGYAVVRATAPDPLTTKDEATVSLRGVVRCVLLAFGFVSAWWVFRQTIFFAFTEYRSIYDAANVFDILQRSRWYGPPTGLDLVAALWATVQFLIWLITLVVVPMYLAQLARRANARWLARLAWASGIAAMILVPLHAVLVHDLFGARSLMMSLMFPSWTPYSRPLTGTASWIVIQWVTGLSRPAIALLGLGILVSVVWLWPVVWREARLARQSWAAASAIHESAGPHVNQASPPQ
jgi:hypothetical protein